MKRQLLVFGILFSICHLHSQDMHEKNFKVNPKDSIDFIAELNLAKNIYREKDYDSVIVLSEQLLAKSLSMGFIRGAGEACFLKARGLNRAGRRNKAMETYAQALEHFEMIDDHDRMASTYNNWGLLLKDAGKFREAIEAAEKALENVNYTFNHQLKFHILNNLGNSYQSLALFKKASDMYYGALKIIKDNQSQNTERLRAEVYINLGIIYLEQNLYVKSLEIYHEAKKSLEKQGLKPQLAALYNNMSAAYIETEDYEKASEYLELSLSISQELNNEIGEAICIDGFGAMNFKQGNYHEAIKLHQTAILKLEEYEVVSYLPSAYLGLGKTYLELGEANKALLSLMKGLQIALKSGQKVKELQIYQGLIDFYKITDELELALLYYDLHSALSYELNDQQIGRHIGQMELKDLLEKRDKALQSLEYEAALLQFQIGRKNTFLILSIALTAIISVMFLLIIRQRKLNSLNRSIRLEQKMLQAQLNPHFIFNALGAIQHYVNLQASEKASEYLAKFSKLMRFVLESSRNSTHSLSNELEVLHNYLDLQSLRFSGPFNYTIEVDPQIDTELIQIPSLIMQPIVENAIEHGLLPKDGGVLKISIELINNRIRILVDDNGVGLENFSENIVGKKHDQASDESGLGTLITRERLNLLGRKNIRFEIINKAKNNPSNAGTIILIEVPLIN